MWWVLLPLVDILQMGISKEESLMWPSSVPNSDKHLKKKLLDALQKNLILSIYWRMALVALDATRHVLQILTY